ncbi:partitioning defective protein 3, partial [Clonorchis sinensis]
MKLTVCFGDTKVVVPCGSGELTIRDLAFSALKRLRHTLPKLDIHERVVVHSVTIARDGGILDWDDLVRDVLDDRELVTAHYSIATLANSTATTLTSATAEKDPTLPLNSTDQLFRHLCTPLVVDLCSDSGAGGSYHSGPQSNEASGSGESATGFPRLTATSGLVRTIAVSSPAACREPGNTLSASAVAEDSNLNGSSRSSSSLSLNMSSGSCNGHHTHSSNTWKQQEQSKTVGEEPVRKNSLPIPDNRGHLTCSHFGSHPSRTTELDRIFRVANHSVTDATFWEPLRPSEPSATLPSSAGRNSSTAENSGVWHQAFSPTTFATLASVLCRRRDCIEMNWDTDEDEDEEEGECRAGDVVRPNENRGNLNFITSDDHARVTSPKAVSRPLSEIWNGKQTTHPMHKNDSSASRIQTYMSPIPPSNVSLLQSVVPEAPEPVVEELSGSDTLQGREKTQDRQSVVGCQTDFVDHPSATKLQSSSVGDKSLPQPSYIHSKATGSLVVQSVTSTTATSLPCWNSAAAGGRQPDFELPSLDLTQPIELLTSTVKPLSSRTFFSGLGVPTIVEEEEEVSVDYDTSLMTSSMHKPASEYLDGPPVATVHHLTQETPEEDYPLLRPDYFVNVDRSEHSSGGTTTKNNREFSPKLGENVESLRDSFVACPSLLQHTTDEISHRSSTPRGLPLPAVLRWLESTQTANEQRAAQSESPTGTNVITSTALHVSGNIPVFSGPTFSDPKTKQEPRTTGEEVRVTRTTNPDTVLVRLLNTRRGENLGIQIKPVFVDSAKLPREANIQSNTTDRVESGLEVHHIMPHGRVAKEGCLSVGDRILSINGISLAGMPFEKGRDMFQAALSQPELVLEVLPRRAPGNTIGQVEPPCEKPEKLCCRLIVIDDQSAKAKEAEAQGKPRSDKPAPPPPPRRSPNTMLTRFPAGANPPFMDEYSQEKTQCETDRHAIVTEPKAAADHTPTLPPKSSAFYKPTALPMEECIEIYLQKGSNGLGFSLTSRDHPVLKERVVCVKSILPGGAALMDGRLHPGDRLVQVDGHDVAILGQARAVHLLREKPVNSIVKLLVWREPTATVSCGPEVVAASNKSLTKDATIPADQTSTKKVENLADYRIHSINPAHFKIFDLYIPLPQTPTNPPMENASTSSPVTLGVSVSVRPSLPPHVPLQASHREPDNSENAVFVRTVIEGGAAHSDGRLQVGDRLLSIDGIPLSGISGADALTRMKTVIARNLAEKRPSVRLLIARLRVEPETSSAHERIGDGSMASATNTVSVETHSTGHVQNMPKHTQSM